jgi:heavy metal response regulator
LHFWVTGIIIGLDLPAAIIKNVHIRLGGFNEQPPSKKVARGMRAHLRRMGCGTVSVYDTIYGMRILVVEDEKKVASFLKKGLEEEYYAVDCAYDGEEALFMVEASDYDLVLLDIMLPKINGLEVLKGVRQRGLTIPVLMLTAKDSVEDVVKGLDAGGDDYLTKPFAFAELLARVRALLRRKERGPAGELRVANLVLDPATHMVRRGGQEIDLTAKEYALLEYLMRHVNRVVTRTMISEHVWDYHFDPMTNVIDVYVNHLRRKIDLDSSQRLIHTVRGVGYMLQDRG